MSTLIKTHSAVDVDFSQRLLEVACPGGEENFYLPYDKLVIACGSVNSTHGVPGLENCFQLKTVQDAQGIRRRVMDNLEKAALPSTTEEERRRLLSFVVCGGGPTGVEFASELWEMVNEDVLNCECRVSPSMSYDSGPLRSESNSSSVGAGHSHASFVPRHAQDPPRRDQGQHHPVARSHPQHLRREDLRIRRGELSRTLFNQG